VASADGNYVLVGGEDAADLWNAATAKHIHSFITSRGRLAKAMAISPDNRWLAVASDTGGKILQVFRNPDVPQD
jgi:hypothetical protein